jgi:CHAD domain-containing protein
VAYRFERGESLTKAVPRIARAQSKNAVEALVDQKNAHERVHAARTAVKKLRGLLRLVAATLGGRFDRENRRLRALGDTLGELRDAEVLIKTFDDLFEHFDNLMGPPLRRVHMRLTTRLRGVQSRMDLPARLDKAAKAFRKTRKRAKKWIPRRGGKPAGGWKALAGGLEDTYRWGREAMSAAYASGDDDDFHEWRKAVKYHGYHIRLLVDLWPEELNGRLDVLERTGELLGQDHDLTIFAATLKNEPDCFDNRRDNEVLLGLISQRQQALRALARPLGRRLFAEPPAVFRRRLHGYWRIWRKHADQRASALLQAERENRPASARKAS